MPLSARVCVGAGRGRLGGMATGGGSSGRSSSSLSYESSSDEEDEIPLAQRVRPAASRGKRANASVSDDSSSSESDKPLSSKMRVPKNGANGKAAPPAAAVKKVKLEEGRSAGSVKASNGQKKAAAPAAKKPRVKAEPEAPVARAKSKPASVAKPIVDRKRLIKAESAVSAASNGSEASGDDDYKWWLEQKGDDGPKWQTLDHNGVLFPPEYVPHGVPLVYKGAAIALPPVVEEVATFFAAVLGTDHAVNPTFQRNFFEDFTELLSTHVPGHAIKDFKGCDFSRIRAHLDEQTAKRKAMTKAEKEQQKKERTVAEEKYEHCVLDGRREKVGNFRIEPPGLFRGRGAHPKTGKLKTRVLPEQVTINIGPNAVVPDPPAGHRWGKVQHDNTVTWLA
ncbi:DNA topoisomerase 1, partial [Coemansia spiralis]